MKVRLLLAGTEHDVEAAWSGDNIVVSLDGRDVTLQVQYTASGMTVLRHGQQHIALATSGSGNERSLWVNGRTAHYEIIDTRRRAAGHHADQDLIASVPGTVQRVLVAEGDQVIAGQTLVVMESMKMEMALAAPHDGVVAEVCVAEGDTVDAGTHLIKLAADES